MNWSEIGTQIILGLVGLVFSGLGLYVTYLINKHIKDKDLKEIVESLHLLVRDCVLEVYQTYVESLKEQNIFNGNAQRIALDKALKLIETNMTPKIKKWLEENVGDIEAYLKGMIETQIALLKNGGK